MFSVCGGLGLISSTHTQESVTAWDTLILWESPGRAVSESICAMLWCWCLSVSWVLPFLRFCVLCMFLFVAPDFGCDISNTACVATGQVVSKANVDLSDWPGMLQRRYTLFRGMLQRRKGTKNPKNPKKYQKHPWYEKCSHFWDIF